MAPLCMAENWPRFRGANGQGISNQSAPIEWNQNKNIKWRSELPGPGSSSPVIFGNKIFGLKNFVCVKLKIFFNIFYFFI